MTDVERFIGNVEFALTTSGAARVRLQQNVTVTADVAVVAFDAASSSHPTVHGRLHHDQLVASGT